MASNYVNFIQKGVGCPAKIMLLFFKVNFVFLFFFQEILEKCLNKLSKLIYWSLKEKISSFSLFISPV